MLDGFSRKFLEKVDTLPSKVSGCLMRTLPDNVEINAGSSSYTIVARHPKNCCTIVGQRSIIQLDRQCQTQASKIEA